MKSYVICIIAAMTGCLFSACSKDEDLYQRIDYNRLGYLITDNQNLSTFNTALQRSSLKQELLGKGSFTVLVPSDEAFLEQGYSPASMATINSSWISNFMAYHTIDGLYDFEKLPFQFNQAIRTRNGHNVFVSRWVFEGDTVETVNGVRVLAADVKASNGYAQVLDKMLEPNTYGTITDHLASISSATMFSHALIRSGLADMLDHSGPYTLFVPSNEAMLAAGFANIEDVEVANPDTLAALVKRHILPGIRFTYDYRITTPYSEIGNASNGRYFDVDYYDEASQTVKSQKAYVSGYRGFVKEKTLSGDEYYFYYTYGDTFSATGLERLLISKIPVPYYLTGVGTTILPQLCNQVADNGVFHVINKVLEP
ncbi:Fasciclin domain-containing protein [bacterium A37T11]|nr:Fasciclin domain-containing protein [bacterium A37T11]